jgi:hypothetical protein
MKDDEQKQSETAEKKRAPYVAPQLTRLGSVRDLTASSTGSVGDLVGAGKRKRTGH